MDSIAAKPIVQAKRFSEEGITTDAPSQQSPKPLAKSGSPTTTLARTTTPPLVTSNRSPPVDPIGSAASLNVSDPSFVSFIDNHPRNDEASSGGGGGGSSDPEVAVSTARPTQPLSGNANALHMQLSRRESDPWGYGALAEEAESSDDRKSGSSPLGLVARLAEVERERDELRRMLIQLRNDRLTMLGSTSTTSSHLGLPKPSTLSDKTHSSSTVSSSKQVSFRDEGEASFEHDDHQKQLLSSSAFVPHPPPSLPPASSSSGESGVSAGSGRGRLMSVGGEVVMSSSFMPLKPTTPPKVGGQPANSNSESPKPKSVTPSTASNAGIAPSIVNFPHNAKAMVPTRNYKLGSVIGTGAFSKVYLGLNYDSGELVAIKVIDFATTDADPSWWMPRLEALKGEIDLMKTLQHPNVVQYFFSSAEVVNSSHRVNIFMEYVPGGSLYKVVQEFGALPEITVSNYVVQICEALAYIHGKGIVHADVKLANILLTAGGSMKLADFGSAILRRGELKLQQQLESSTASRGSDSSTAAAPRSSGSETALPPPADAQPPSSGEAGSYGDARDGGMRGTLLYMSPQLLREERGAHTPAADIWSLGVLTCEMLTGKPPWSHLGLPNTFAIIRELTKDDNEPTKLPTEAGLSMEALSFLRLCLAKNPDDRPAADRLLSHAFLDEAGSIVAQRAVSVMSLSVSNRSLFSSSLNLPTSFGSMLDYHGLQRASIAATAGTGSSTSSMVNMSKGSSTASIRNDLQRIVVHVPDDFSGEREHPMERERTDVPDVPAGTTLGDSVGLSKTLAPDEVERRGDTTRGSEKPL